MRAYVIIFFAVAGIAFLVLVLRGTRRQLTGKEIGLAEAARLLRVKRKVRERLEWEEAAALERVRLAVKAGREERARVLREAAKAVEDQRKGWKP
jgi:hypothetical protein